MSLKNALPGSGYSMVRVQMCKKKKKLVFIKENGIEKHLWTPYIYERVRLKIKFFQIFQNTLTTWKESITVYLFCNRSGTPVSFRNCFQFDYPHLQYHLS